MKSINKRIFISFALTLLMLIALAIPTSAASPLKVNLGTTSTFAVLAGSEITNTGTTTIDGDAGGDVGLYPAAASFFTGQAGITMSGDTYLSDGPGVASQAQADLTIAYNDAAGRTPTTAIVADLGGTTLKSGVYNSASSIGITGTLTLDAEGDPEAVFIFQAGSTLTLESDSEIVLINGARYCRVFWQVGSSATLGTNSKFVGHIFALTSITANTGATVEGQLLARNGAVTLDSNVITNGFCPVIAAAPIYYSPVYPPLINVIKTPAPLALTSGGGAVTYTYVVTNPGIPALSNVSVSDDKVSTVSYISGDVNLDNQLQPSESWIYTATTTLSETTTNTATARGSANGMTATDIAYATVNVAPTPVYPPLINVIKTADPPALDSEGGSVTYTYTVTNPGVVELSDVSVTDDKVSPVSYVSGDVNLDNLLQPSETWIYTGTATLSETTMNTATAQGSANGMTATDIATATVVVPPVGETVTGGELPGTATPWYNILLIGAGMVILGAVVLIFKKKHD